MRDRLAGEFADWMALIERLATESIETGEMVAAVARQLAYEIESLGMTAVMQARLLTDVGYLFARRAVLDRLRSLATDPTLLPEDMSSPLLPLAVNDGRADQRDHYGHVEPMFVHFDDI